ncbi:hypothetical protein M0R45_020034 [Rubus argutus]|uniref:Uncharacterized protein n=1 Tax=Rubus argutus TaxID=59490 RepID=A0AAW1X815_RUBAR
MIPSSLPISGPLLLSHLKGQNPNSNLDPFSSLPISSYSSHPKTQIKRQILIFYPSPASSSSSHPKPKSNFDLPSPKVTKGEEKWGTRSPAEPPNQQEELGCRIEGDKA